MNELSSIFGMGELGGPPDAELRGPLLSIHMHSNRPKDFRAFLDRLQEATNDKSAVEVVVKIDDTDPAMHELLDHEVHRRPFRLTCISTPPPATFFDLWTCFEDLLRACHPDAYFVVNLNDEMSFKTDRWDSVLRKYVGLFPDHIFRLRTSPHRNRNYYDFWEAGFANDTSAIMTKRWLELGGGWCPCNGPDTFQQSVAFYLGWLDRFNANREAREFAIYDIEFTGHGASHGLSGHALRKRQSGSIPFWFNLMSHKMQQEAARRAQRLRAHIWANQHEMNCYDVQDNRRRRRIEVLNPVTGDVVHGLEYGLNRLRIGLTNAFRTLNYGYYCAGGMAYGGWLTSIVTHLCLRYEAFDLLEDYYAAHGLKPAGKSASYYLRRALIRLLTVWPQRVMHMQRSSNGLWRLPGWTSRGLEILAYQMQLLRNINRDPAGPSSIDKLWKKKLYRSVVFMFAIWPRQALKMVQRLF